MIKILRDYFEYEIDLSQFISALKDKIIYENFLNDHTQEILRRFADRSQSWGAARKGLNLFLREVVYNKFMAEKFLLPIDFIEFNDFIKSMEVPLDRDVANGLIYDSRGVLPKWTSIKDINEERSILFQNTAYEIAKNKNIARVNLDLIYWRTNPEKTYKESFSESFGAFASAKSAQEIASEISESRKFRDKEIKF